MKRYYNLDLLRLVCIYFVVCIHYFGWGGLSSATNVGIINLGLGGGLAVACNIAVNCFYMISGFFIKDTETLEGCKNRIVRIWSSALFYSVIIPLLLLAFGQIDLDLKSIVLLFFPVMGNQYWFASCYIAVTALLPFIAKGLKQLDNKQVGILLAVMLVIDCIQPLFGVNAFSNIGYGPLHAVTMYVLGYWIKRNIQKITAIKAWRYIATYVIAILLIAMIILLSVKFSSDRNRTIADYNSILLVIASFGFFCAFLKFKVNTTLFSRLSPYVFGVYLLNDNQYARQFLWQNIFHCSDYHSSSLLVLHFLIVTILFMVVGLAVEYVRLKSFGLIKSKIGAKKKWLIFR